jgi:hypothetical protein
VNLKGMHWHTFNALREQIAAAAEKDAAWFKGAARLLARSGALAELDRLALGSKAST